MKILVCAMLAAPGVAAAQRAMTGPNALTSAASSLADGRFDEARTAAASLCSATDAGAALRERACLIEGVAERAANDFIAAERSLRVPGSTADVLEPYRLYYLADAELYAGDAPDAARDFAAARASAPVDALRNRAAGRLGDALALLGKPCEAADALGQGMPSDSSAERLAGLAQALDACGRPGAADARKRLWLDHPEHPLADSAVPHEPETGAERVQRAAKLASRGNEARAVAELMPLRASREDPEVVSRGLLLLAKVESDLHQSSEAHQDLLATLAAKPTSESSAEAAILLGREAWRRRDLAQAEFRFLQVARAHLHDHLGDDAAFLYAFLPLDSGDFKAGAKRFEALLASRPRSRKADEAAWFAAYTAYRLGNRDGARQGFVRLATRFPNSPLHPAALYWQARTSPASEAIGLYRQIREIAPPSYYAGLAAMQLAALGQPAPPFCASNTSPASLAALPPLASLAEDLASTGLAKESAEVFDAVARTLSHPAEFEALAAAESASGVAGRSYAVANGRLWGLAFEGGDRRALELLFPRPHLAEVTAAASVSGLDPNLVFAIMRRESAFDPLVISRAHAVGLLQVLPSTAQRVGAVLEREETFDNEALQRPDAELPVSVWYLAQLASRFGSVALVAAGYNGGPGALSQWLSDRGQLPLDEFVESIPFRETRMYVKNVVGDYLAYRAIYAETEHPCGLGLGVPEPHAGANF